MEICHYASFFQLVAGLSAALTGVDFLTKNLVDKCTKRHSRDVEEHKALKLRVHLQIKRAKELAEGSEADKKEGIYLYIGMINRRLNRYEKLIAKFPQEKVAEGIVSKVPKISFFIFAYCTLLIIFGGIQDDHVDVPLSLLGTINILSFVSIIIITAIVDLGKEIRFRSSLLFLICTYIFSFWHANSDTWGVKADENVVLFSSIFFCFFGFMAIGSKPLVYYYVISPVAPFFYTKKIEDNVGKIFYEIYESKLS